MVHDAILPCNGAGRPPTRVPPKRDLPIRVPVSPIRQTPAAPGGERP